MKLINLKLIVCCLLFQFHETKAQVTRTNIVEHFTNTSCSICASRNPNIHNAINNNPGTLHISFHPSVPYTSDFFNKQNKVENDQRTIFYDVFYGTPVVVLNGVDINDNQLPNLLSQNTETNFTINVIQTKVTSDSFDVRTTITKISEDNQSYALLFLGAMEDTIQQSTNNGEKTHYNVFRKSLTKVTGDTMSLPEIIGDSVVHSFSYKAGSAWQVERLHTIGILQQFERAVINSAKSINVEPTTTSTKDKDVIVEKTVFFPNPFHTTIETNRELNNIKIYNSTGQVMLSKGSVLKDSSLDLSGFPTGIYFVKGNTETEIFTQKIIKNQ